MMSWKSNKQWPLLLATIGVLVSHLPVAIADERAGEFNYFGSGIDYWHEKRPEVVLPSKRFEPSKTGGMQERSSAQTSAERFSWEKYLDPKNKEFFREGDYTPPEPFMEIVRNPTDSNLKMWFAYIDKRNELSNRLQARMKEYLEKSGAALNDESQGYLKSHLGAVSETAPNAKRFRFRMYFDSHCPHCKRMFGTLAELRDKGFYVEARQVDRDPRGVEGLPIPSTQATASELEERQIQSVPLLLVGDLEKKVIYRVSGFRTAGEIFNEISKGETHR